MSTKKALIWGVSLSMWSGTLKEAPWYETWLPLPMMMDVSMRCSTSHANLDKGVKNVMCGDIEYEDVGSIVKDGAYQVHGALTAYTWLWSSMSIIRLGLMSSKS